MHTLLSYLLLVPFLHTDPRPSPETPQQSLNQYVAFMNQSVDVLMYRFQMLQAYQAQVKQYRENPSRQLTLSSSGPLEDYYYQKALTTSGLIPAEKQRLTASTQALWQLLTKLDQAGKALETYVRLKDYQRDDLKQSDALVGTMQTLFGQFSRDRTAFFTQIQGVYRRYQPYLATDPYLAVEKEMEQILLSQEQLLDRLPYYLLEDSLSDWPVKRVQESMLADEASLAAFGKVPSVGYPASSMVTTFRTAIQSIQAVKRQAIDDYTFTARQSSRHGNSVYLSLLNYYNQDLLASYQAFVNYSQTTRSLLDHPKFSPVFARNPPGNGTRQLASAVPFEDKPLINFAVKPSTSFMGKVTCLALNGYVEFINESLRQMHQMQLLIRNYQSSAELYRDPNRARQRANLNYSHEDYKIPVSAYQLLATSSQFVPAAYRPSINIQAAVLLAILSELDGLSIELIGYTSGKNYLQDQLQRSDAILDRYAVLFETFDQKKEQLYRDVRRIYESYPVANPASAWVRAGQAMLKTLDDDKAALFGVKAYLRFETAQLPATASLEANARSLITNEYQNLTGLQRLGRSNGLCPYSPYEDIAENTIRFAEMIRKVKPELKPAIPHTYQSFFFFFNNQLVYEYNKFTELSKENLLKAVNQPDVFAFRRDRPSGVIPSAPKPPDPPVPSQTEMNQPATSPQSMAGPAVLPVRANEPAPIQRIEQHDTVYVERTKVDTVFVDRSALREVSPSLSGFAANNMVLLLDVSASMDSPVKMPLLKRSIKSLLTLLRPEDQISIVIYSGKAKVALKPTSGDKASEIARVIDALESNGDTDGNGGLKLAYKVANKAYIRAGNNRIVLATDGEFPVSDEVLQLIRESAGQDVYLTVFTFGRNALTGQNLRKLSQLGKGTFTHVTPENANSQLILEAQAKPVLSTTK